MRSLNDVRRYYHRGSSYRNYQRVRISIVFIAFKVNYLKIKCRNFHIRLYACAVLWNWLQLLSVLNWQRCALFFLAKAVNTQLDAPHTQRIRCPHTCNHIVTIIFIRQGANITDDCGSLSLSPTHTHIRILLFLSKTSISVIICFRSCSWNNVVIYTELSTFC